MADFSTVVQQFMRERGMSLRALARAASYDAGHLSKVIRGLKPPTEELALCLDRALGAGGAILSAVPEHPRGHTPGGLEDEPVAPEVVGYFRGQLPGHYEADMFLGPRHLIPIVKTQAEQIIRLASCADGAVRAGLLNTGTAYAALLGWLYQDAGDLAASARWRDVTLSMAHRARDAQLISYALTNKAMLAIDLGDGRGAADFAAAALAGERRLCAKARLLALQHQAQGHAMLGDRPRADRLLAQAGILAGRVDDDYPWGNACRRTPCYVEVQRATCYGRTGRRRDAADAAGLWDEILGSMSARARRDNAVFAARQARSLALVPDPDRAVALAAGAAAQVAVTGSARLRRELLELPAHARGWASTRAGRELAGIVAAIA